jgi:hypothetical protein
VIVGRKKFHPRFEREWNPLRDRAVRLLRFR